MCVCVREYTCTCLFLCCVYDVPLWRKRLHLDEAVPFLERDDDQHTRTHARTHAHAYGCFFLGSIPRGGDARARMRMPLPGFDSLMVWTSAEMMHERMCDISRIWPLCSAAAA